VLSPGSVQYGDALYWRAFTSTTAADAERDYRRLTIEYPLSSRSADALLHLAQLEYARHDRLAAHRHFDQFLREHPTGPLVAKASYWSAQLSLDEGDMVRACALLANARKAATSDDVELTNQIEYHLTRCLPVTTDSALGGVRDSVSSGRRDTSSAKASLSNAFSIQVASYSRKGDASILAARLKRRGFESRVVGTEPPYRVRLGRYLTREQAAAELTRVRRGNPRAIIVPAEPR
jgi:hypothetical protein